MENLQCGSQNHHVCHIAWLKAYLHSFISVNDNNMDISVNDNNMNMKDHIVNLPKKGLKTRPYSMDMNKDIATLPKKGLKTRPYNIGMEKKG